MQLLDGSSCSQQIRHEISLEVAAIIARGEYPSRFGTPGNTKITTAKSRTKILTELSRTADILLVATGKTEFVTADKQKEGAMVVGVSQIQVPDGSKKSGFSDVDFDYVKDMCTCSTDVSRGVDPMTRASLLQNTLKAHHRK